MPVHGGTVALHNADILEASAEVLGNDLRQCRLQSLSVRGDAESGSDRAGRIDANIGRFGAGVNGHAGRDRYARADAGQLRVRRDSDAKPAALRARFPLCHTQRVVTDRVAGGIEAFLEAGLIPHDAGSDLVGKLTRADEIA